MYVDTFTQSLLNIFSFFILFIHVLSSFFLEPHLWRILSLWILPRLLFYVYFSPFLRQYLMRFSRFIENNNKRSDCRLFFHTKKSKETIKPICNSFTMFFCVWAYLGAIKRLCHLEIFTFLYRIFCFLSPLWRQNVKYEKFTFIIYL